MTFLTRQAFAKMFKTSPDDLDMHVIYDVSHNIAKVQSNRVDVDGMEWNGPDGCPHGRLISQPINPLNTFVLPAHNHTYTKVEEHMFQGRPRTLLVHRKGSTRAFPPHHPLIPVDYQFTGA